MTESTCPRCGAAANGNFCASCGASLGGRTCGECGTPAEPGARFCTGCGLPLGAASASGAASAPVAGSAPGAGSSGAGSGTGHARVGAQAAASTGQKSQIGWWMAGTMLVFLLAVVAYPILVPQLSREQAPGPTGGAQSQLAPSQFGNANAVDLSSMSPIEQADRLFTRVMTASESGQTEQVQFFLPMAVAAYEQAEPLNADGLYHLSALQRMSGDAEASLATAQRILDERPTHLFGLSEAGEALLATGDTAQAREYFGDVLANWADELGTDLQEYALHTQTMPSIRQRAEEISGGG